MGVGVLTHVTRSKSSKFADFLHPVGFTEGEVQTGLSETCFCLFFLVCHKYSSASFQFKHLDGAGAYCSEPSVVQKAHLITYGVGYSCNSRRPLVCEPILKAPRSATPASQCLSAESLNINNRPLWLCILMA